ncbi:hypothetical protein QYE76_031686 [Lolium multiflorum]|uniref:DRBM domain-containing protein n=1 Tax=Lolium multiflorum TaxID=4521 RepID=A0AAD8VKN4_LOLMU|nr:hypothetical protein QYE76_031686 [Lolium multiflorum]
MAATAAAAATAASVPDVPPAAALPAPPAPPHPGPEKCNYKNRLQEWTQRNYQKLPVYLTQSKGDPHQLVFRSTVEVGGKTFPSDRNHSRLKDAEQDAAKVACENLVTIDDPTDVLGLIEQGVVFCKSILNEFAVKTKATQPTYSVDRPKGLPPMTLFVSSVLFSGNTYTGEAATNKKDAEQKAARAAIKSILATNNTCMKEIIRSKKELIIAIASSGFNKETNAVTTVTPIIFVRAVGAACPTADQGANIITEADPSGQAVSGSKKRKKHRTTGQNVNHRSVRLA